MPGENEDKELLDGERNEAETDASPEPEPSEVGDDSQDATEGDGAEAEGQEVEAVDEVEKRPSRGEQRFQRLANESKEAKAEAAQLRRELAEFKVQQRQESPDQIAQRMALMTPEERLEYKIDQAERRNVQTMQNMQFQVRDTGDRSAFNALCASNTTAARYQSRVEAKLAEIRGQGQDVSREALFKFLVGEDVVAKGGAAKAKQAKDGERRTERQSVRPTNSRGDTQANRRGDLSETEARDKRLEGATF